MVDSTSELPDEMLHEILLPVFSVPDDKFASTEGESPFSSVTQSSSAMLLVCKRWLRVAYPLLYRTAVVRSSGQAQALADTLKANKDLGKHVKKLRLEGGYGTATRTILTLAPNITDLYLSLIIWSDDSVSGLCRSLTAINPSRVILYDAPFQPKFNAKVRQLVLKLCDCIPLWSNLVTFHFPYFAHEPGTSSNADEDAYAVPTEERSKLIAQALRNAPNLEIVYSPPGHWLPHDLVTISENPRLKTIRITSSYDGIGVPFQRALNLKANARVQAIVEFNEVPTEPVSDHKPPTFSPSSLSKLQQAPEDVQDNIWSEILAFVLYVDLRPICPRDVRATAISDWRRMLLLVSKKFHRLALPHFYNHPIILTRKALLQFSERLLSDTSLGLHIRSLFLWKEVGLVVTEFEEGAGDDKKAILHILSRAPRLTRVYGADLRGNIRRLLHFLSVSSLSWEAFCLMADTAGPSLLEFDNVPIYGVGKVCTPCLFYSFTALRTLFWDCGTEIDMDDEAILRDCFPCLEDLRISRCDPSFVELLIHIDLPALSRFAYTAQGHKRLENLFKIHGHKLYELELKASSTELFAYDSESEFEFESGFDISSSESSGDSDGWIVPSSRRAVASTTTAESAEGFNGLSIFDLCPSLNMFACSSFPSYDRSSTFRPKEKHLSLVKIAVSCGTMPFFGDDLYDKFFASLDFTDFPALQEISVDRCFWTTDERKIPKNPWVARSEALLRSGVTLTNKDGHPWRPRLKKSKR